MKILLFGVLADLLNADRVEIDHQPDLTSLKRELALRFPAIGDQSFTLAINKHKPAEDYLIQSSDEIALLPPFSGG